MGGHYNVGLKELRGDLAARKPPISVFYPTTSAPDPCGVDCIPFHDTQYLRGMARFAGVPFFLLRDLLFNRCCMRADAPPAQLFQEEGMPRPIAVFSHGYAGFPRLYNALLMDMAARGVVVFAVTHMDTSASYCRDAGGSLHIPFIADTKWTTEATEPLLAMRVRETRNTIRGVRTGELLRSLGYTKEVVDRYLAMDQPIHLVGHSFGGATAMVASLEEEKAAKDNKVPSPIASVVAYDPWGVPMKEDMFLRRLIDRKDPCHYTTPTLLFFSEAWIHDKAQCDFFADAHNVITMQEHTEEEAAVIDAANRKLKSQNATWYTRRDVYGTGHLSFTDAVLFSRVVHRKSYMKVAPRASIVGFAHGTVQFMKTIAGPIPFGKDMASDPALTAVFHR
ncbi:putative Phospholipase A2-like protein [Leptomonas pyrrhocoris]|uniref:1-alkyl-2-acetylglycerophosphocholine esterase n=1 Tax=Leptomonas pyrrhocoris TaxID=157538 RepID=A0A0N0E0D3_LEPPY|nr:putative Phospholipase A2-like protein [Leptomonas pyrrhocoris]XP_015664753.1 putative Phospholipase A2-like protein [Leptomonas pyrrhocoris]XP_015664754.1 putative Phospholipase A2-like protein [Leptomonas pyrrhocoris]KPA86313.1 putative Phospholipase A2-like protein [Leptomonas pyrrhocoris]KPA86314.1 putative Phospholipase A2-like protein [Leptomonas pyrrhocoris]KPA86315.1 putative Phospholipase A2-like protein [Leptomonas pyrrhocoris]|eukprot:XP_015664752.1 putative Phospholipase A2-like protein [Leptomonas pyrrhocoris]